MKDRYLLDTHILIWLLNDSNRLNKNIREDIDYFQHLYYVSVETLREIVILKSLKKITFDYNLDKIITRLQERMINILPIEARHIKALEKLPVPKINGKAHEEPFDRMLISQAIADKHTLISSDAKFPFYKDYGLQLLVNER
ncbi:PIN domain protein [Bacteroidales bacterium Barb6]|nr:PIN domain protein [Bacteroidales bacterium Barb6]